MKINSYNILCEIIKSAQLGLTPTPQGIRQANRIAVGKDAAHSKPGHKQAATKFLKKIPPLKIQSAGIRP